MQNDNSAQDLVPKPSGTAASDITLATVDYTKYMPDANASTTAGTKKAHTGRRKRVLHKKASSMSDPCPWSMSMSKIYKTDLQQSIGTAGQPHPPPTRAYNKSNNKRCSTFARTHIGAAPEACHRRILECEAGAYSKRNGFAFTADCGGDTGKGLGPQAPAASESSRVRWGRSTVAA